MNTELVGGTPGGQLDRARARVRLRGRARPLGQRLGRAVPALVVFALVVGVWELWPRLADTPTYLLPRPTDVFEAVREEFGTLLHATWRTALTSLVGLLLAIVCGVGGAVLLGLSPTLERTLFPYAIVVQTTPTVTIAPIAIIWIGAGNWSIIAVSVILCFFPMLSNTLVGLNSSDPETRSLLKLYGASRLETMRKLRLPGSMPYIMAGVRISAGLSVIGAMVGEFVVGAGGSEGGLGALVQKSAEQLKTALLVSGALAGGCLGIAYYVGAKQLSNHLLGWHESMADGAGQGGRVRLD